MKLIKLGVLLGLFTFSLLTTPLMGGVAKVTDMICERLKDPCTMPLKYGSCYNIHFRYFYNFTSGFCESFVYSGCDGNLNNYELQIECQLACEKKGKKPSKEPDSEEPSGSKGETEESERKAH
uniref:BPTI/Kunitz inhibitor domain-containing protein n=1 Tax=Capra hircus TaxID=9925 RepID=A0A452ERE8_CAPHI